MYRRDEKIERLVRVPMFSACNRKELGLLASRADEVSLEEGAVLVREGEAGHEFYVIVDGKATVSRGGKDVALLGAGDFFGELALLDGQRRNATVTAASPIDVLCVDQSRFSALLEDVPHLARKVMVGMARRLQELDAKA